MAVDFHTGVTPDRPVAELAELAAHAEDLGMKGVWIADSQTVFRDVYVAMAACAARTTTVLLGPAVSNIVTRHPSVLAGAIATLAEMTSGRVALGLGVGGSATSTVGLDRSRLADLEEAILAIQAMLSGGAGRYRGHELKMSWGINSGTLEMDRSTFPAITATMTFTGQNTGTLEISPGGFQKNFTL